ALFRSGADDLRDRPMSIFTVTATGNFRYSEDSCQNMIDCVEAGIPVEIVPVTLMGLIAPVTIVGATVFHTVDVLAGITMAQVIRPGAPVLFGGAPATFHMKIASSPMSAIEALQLDAAYVAVAKSLGLPTTELIRQLMADQHLIMADHTMRHWPEELYLPSSIVDRDNRENWTKLGAKDAYQRARDEVDRRLAAYHQLETDPAIDSEL